ncbi:hypothetical protein CEXT_295971 [Caerostris extrusa]|uniref:Uncharacterized protein n=1 Tax=Caerostris extrusa TaxID=172846 RepID=A0AAV4UU56_CAEEX|nr:hypothetical protein CEXT_295971 [Caerostris extrusa]
MIEYPSRMYNPYFKLLFLTVKQIYFHDCKKAQKQAFLQKNIVFHMCQLRPVIMTRGREPGAPSAFALDNHSILSRLINGSNDLPLSHWVLHLTSIELENTASIQGRPLRPKKTVPSGLTPFILSRLDLSAPRFSMCAAVDFFNLNTCSVSNQDH